MIGEEFCQNVHRIGYMVFCKMCGKILGSCGVYSGRYIYLLNLIRPAFQYRTLVDEFKTLSIARPKFLAAGRILIPLQVQKKLSEGAYLDVWKFLEIKIEKYRETSKVCIERRFRKAVPTDRLIYRRNGVLQTCAYENSVDAINELATAQLTDENTDVNQSEKSISINSVAPEKAEALCNENVQEDVNMDSNELSNHNERGASTAETNEPMIDETVSDQCIAGPLDFTKSFLDSVLPVEDGKMNI